MDTSEFDQAPIPDGISSLLEEDFPEELKPGNGASLTDKMAWNAVEAVAQIGGKVDPDTEGQCPEIEGRTGETATCTVRYFGEEFEYRLEVTSGEGVLIQSTGTVAPLPLTRETVADHFRFQTTFEHVTCDMDDLVVAEEGVETGVVCRAWSPEHSALTTADVVASQSGPEFPNIETEYNAVEKG
mgnify:CR=1 FL=1